MGEVFRARDRLTGGPVAVKVLFASAARDLERFQREAQILAEVTHPRIVSYVAHGIAQGDRPYIAMEWLEGSDLGDHLSHSGLTMAQSLAVARRTAEALAALHDRGIVHRDVKPSNLYLVGNDPDKVKVLDFGVARLLHASHPSTRSGVMVGTPGYMAPEQARGMKEIDARADIFSLGCVLFECLAGRPVFIGDNIAALLAKILLETPPTLGEVGIEVPPQLEDLLARMLSKHATARPANGATLLRELDQIKGLADGPAQRASVPRQRSLTGSERRLVSVVMASFAPGTVMEEVNLNETVAAVFDPRVVTAAFGAEAEVLADGTVVVTLANKGGATDQAAHAARCALALRSHMIDVHLALATGLATMNQEAVVGEVIERAAALLASAKTRAPSSGDETMAGQSPIFLDETTAGLLDMQFDVGGDNRGLFIRGLREREARGRTLLGKETPFVGRDRELGTMVGLLDECLDERVARALLVTGPAGAGKSRITSELLAKVRERPKVEVWIARGDPMREGSPFSLVASLVRRAAGIQGSESLAVKQQKLRARVARNIREDDVARVTEFVGEIASVHYHDTNSVQLRAARQDPQLMGDQMRRAFCELVVAEARAAPLVVVLEDLHWGDLPSVSFLDSALRAASDRAFMVVAVARSEVHEQFPGLWEQRSVQEVRLGPLVRRAGEKLIRDVLGESVANDVVERLLDGAAGNAFYLEELIRAHAEAPPRPSGGSMPPPALGALAGRSELAVPGTVLAMVGARLERLDASARRVLRAASVFGEVFWRGGVLAMTGGQYEASQVDEWLSQLARREIVQRRDFSRFPGEHEYSFRHALVRDAAYEMLTADDRAFGHRLAGEWLENAGEHEPMLLAEHFERGGAVDKALGLYLAGAQAALEGNDFLAAEERADRAIAAGASGETLGRLHHLLAEAARWQGRHDVALQHARGAMHNLPEGSDDWCAAAAEAVDAAAILGLHVEMSALTSTLTSLAPNTAARIIATGRVADRLVMAGAFEQAKAAIDRIERESAAILESEPAARAFTLSAKVSFARLDQRHRAGRHRRAEGGRLFRSDGRSPQRRSPARQRRVRARSARRLSYGGAAPPRSDRVGRCARLGRRRERSSAPSRPAPLARAAQSRSDSAHRRGEGRLREAGRQSGRRHGPRVSRRRLPALRRARSGRGGGTAGARARRRRARVPWPVSRSARRVSGGSRRCKSSRRGGRRGDAHLRVVGRRHRSAGLRAPRIRGEPRSGGRSRGREGGHREGPRAGPRACESHPESAVAAVVPRAHPGARAHPRARRRMAGLRSLVLAVGLLIAIVLAACGGPAERAATPRAKAGAGGVVASNVQFEDYAGTQSCAKCHASHVESWLASPMHNMTRRIEGATVRGPFDGTVMRFHGDTAKLETVSGEKRIAITSERFGSATYRLTRVIGGHHREDYVGRKLEGGDEMVLPVSFVYATNSLRYKGYSVMVKERGALKAGPAWAETCIFCHNTPPYLSTVLGALAPSGRANAYQGEVVDPLLPEAKRAKYIITDTAAFGEAISHEIGRIGGDKRGTTARDGIVATRGHFRGEQLVETGIGCEACHLGSAEHVRDPSVHPTFEPKSSFFALQLPNGESRSERINRTCARCHQVLFSGYDFTWEGGGRHSNPGGSNINSGEARDLMMGACSSKLSCVDCHDPHGKDATAALRALPNKDVLCTKCHEGKATKEHTHHEGVGCLSCHMPNKTMNLDGGLGAYHRIGSPTSPTKVHLDRPIECALCHADKSVGSLVTTMETWWKKKYDRVALEKLYGSLDANVLLATAERGKPHEQAVAFAVLGDKGVKAAAPILAKQLTHPLPIVRGYAKRALDEIEGHVVDIDIDAEDADIEAKARSLYP